MAISFVAGRITEFGKKGPSLAMVIAQKQIRTRGKSNWAVGAIEENSQMLRRETEMVAFIIRTGAAISSNVLRRGAATG